MDSCVSATFFLLMLSCGLAMQAELETVAPPAAPVDLTNDTTASSEATNETTTTVSTSANEMTATSEATNQNSAVDTSTNQTTAVDTTTAKTIEQKICKTGKGDEGKCVPRQLCDYGTPYIDFTLYARHDYVKQCLLTEVCCPDSFVVKPTEHTVQSNDFNFDEDD